MRSSAILLIALAVISTACASTAIDSRSNLVWPAAGVDSPAEILYRGVVGEPSTSADRSLWDKLAGAPTSRPAGGLLQPVIPLLHRNTVVVLDSGLESVLLYELSRGRNPRALGLPRGFTPGAIAVGSDSDRLLIAARSEPVVLEFSVAGDFEGQLSLDAQIERVGGLHACRNGDLLVTDVEAGRLYRFSPTGELLAQSGSSTPGGVQLNRPTAITETADGSVWVLDTLSFKIRRLSPALEPIDSFGTLGDSSGHLALPKGLTADAEGRLYVTDARFDLVQIFDRQGRFLLSFGQSGSGKGHFLNPAGIFCDSMGTLVVADTGNRRLQLFQIRPRDVAR